VGEDSGDYLMPLVRGYRGFIIFWMRIPAFKRIVGWSTVDTLPILEGRGFCFRL